MAALGLGLAALGRPAYLNTDHGRDLGPVAATPETLEARAHQVLDAAYASGIRYVDVARSYGYAEAFVASWLRETGHDDVVVGSKWGYTYTGNWRVGTGVVHEVKDHSLAALRRQYAESRAQLGDHLNLYQIHSATLESGVLDDRGVLDELRRIRDDGIAVGLTASGPHQGDIVRRALPLDVFESVQCTWNLLEPSAGPALGEAAAAGWRVIVKEAMANGRLATGGPAAARAALAAVLAQPWASIVLSGAATVAQLEDNLRAAALAEPPAEYWARRAALPWT